MAKAPIIERSPKKDEAAPAISLPFIAKGMEEEQIFDLNDFSNKILVLFFYPKDDTSGCTAEAIEFTEKKAEFEKLGASIFGISPNPIKMHKKFIAKYDLDVPLIADEEKTTLEAYSTWIEKSMYGRKYMGVERSTFIIQSGTIKALWRKVKVPGHVDEVIKVLKTL